MKSFSWNKIKAALTIHQIVSRVIKRQLRLLQSTHTGLDYLKCRGAQWGMRCSICIHVIKWQLAEILNCKWTYYYLVNNIQHSFSNLWNMWVSVICSSVCFLEFYDRKTCSTWIWCTCSTVKVLFKLNWVEFLSTLKNTKKESFSDCKNLTEILCWRYRKCNTGYGF